MPIDIRGLLGIEQPTSYKLHAARRSGLAEPLDAYARDREEWLKWNRWRGLKDDFNRPCILALIDYYPEKWTWVFGGIFRVLSRDPGQGYTYEIAEVEQYAPLVGRLKVNLEIGRGRSFRLENLLDRITVTELLREPFSGEPFNGYDNVSLDFGMLEALVARDRADWKAALSNMKGIYVIVDRSTGKKYVGSAYGDAGIWSRWCSYAATGHGNNKDLIPLAVGASVEYARTNFRLTLLEAWHARAEDSFIVRRESYWKEALLTRGDWGYNKN